MSAESGSLEELLGAISDGRPPAWEAVGSEIDAGRLAWLESLREISRIAEYNRGLQRHPPALSLAAGVRIGTYEIVAPLGIGGMGEVYRARDVRLGREVALKVLPAMFARDSVHLARIEREARTVAGLNHPNIVTLYSIEDEDELRFLTMELVEGQTLTDLVTPGGLPLRRVLEIGIAIVDALAAAHDKGIVHRDLKPANVMVTQEGRVKVLDFGLAKQSSGITEPDGTPWPKAEGTFTEPSSIAGTVPYMAPEQIRHEAMGACTDLFALGVILYELLCGRRPFIGKSPTEVSQAILDAIPEPMSAGDVSADMERLVGRCLEKEAAKRVQSAAEVGREMRRLKQGLDLGDARFSSERVASIAVLPFVNRSRDEDEEYFSDGIADELLHVLSGIRGLRVAARASSFRFKGRDASIAEIGSALHVATVLVGSVRRAGTRVRIAVQLVNVSDGYHLWSQSYDRTLDDILAVQDDIAHSVVKELRTSILGEQIGPGDSGELRTEVASAARGRAHDGEALRIFLMGRFFLDRYTRNDTTRAIGYLQESLARDPEFALAWLELGRAYAMEAGRGWVPARLGYGRASEAVKRSLALEPDLAEAYGQLARIQLTHGLDRQGAEASLARALELAPSNARVLRMAALHATTVGRSEEAVDLYHRAVELDPLSSPPYHNLGIALHGANRLAEAEMAFRRALVLSPKRAATQGYLSQVLLAQDRGDEALEVAKDEPEEVFRLWALTAIHHALGQCAESDEALAGLSGRYGDDAAFQIAEAHASRGEVDAAFDWLQRAYVLQDGGLSEMKQSPLLRPLQPDPRWRQFLGKMGLEEIQ